MSKAKQKHFWKEKKIICADTEETIIGYENYLKSKHWKLKREEAYSLYNGICQRCGEHLTRDQACVHHRSYKRIGKEKTNLDLICVCKKCHKIIHNQKADFKNTSNRLHIYINSLSKQQKEKALIILENKFGGVYE